MDVLMKKLSIVVLEIFRPEFACGCLNFHHCKQILKSSTSQESCSTLMKGFSSFAQCRSLWPDNNGKFSHAAYLVFTHKQPIILRNRKRHLAQTTTNIKRRWPGGILPRLIMLMQQLRHHSPITITNLNVLSGIAERDNGELITYMLYKWNRDFRKTAYKAGKRAKREQPALLADLQFGIGLSDLCCFRENMTELSPDLRQLPCE
ncbi:hypothetical protein T10_1575 [Trichinella papuae]|uniref:Uncharacterized protein n=1 Tax=Trichinella papuae TaxID=268474 RepID=A0A0V1MFV5_9BILA|nr:hypothetical protein T10_1575 [Trichinella papuae]